VHPYIEGPDRRKGAGVTVTNPPCLGEEDHIPCSPPPQTIAREEDDAVKVAQLAADLDALREKGRTKKNSQGCLPPFC
jgi:hypothetical protein